MIQGFFGNIFKQTFRLEQDKKNAHSESKKPPCSNEETKIPEIPPELLQNIFTFLEKQDKFITSLANKSWRANTIAVANREFPNFLEIYSQYCDFIKSLAPYLCVIDMEKLLMIKEKFESGSSFPEFLMHEMKKNLVEILKKLQLEKLNELKKNTPKKFLRLVKVELIDKQIDKDLTGKFDEKLFIKSLKKLMTYGELNKALNYLNKSNIVDKNATLFDCMKYLVRHKRHKLAIQIFNSNDFKSKNIEYLEKIFYSIKNVRSSIECASLLKSPYSEVAYKIICKKVGCQPDSSVIGFPDIPNGLISIPKKSLISICVKLAETDIDLAKTIVNDVSPEIRDDILNKMAISLKSLNQIDTAEEILELISNREK